MKGPTLLALLALGASLFAADPRGDSPAAAPSTPEAQRAMFHVPNGFEVQLVAAEPDIQKPLSLNFDASGRLWATGTALYPWPAATDANGKPIPGFERGWQEMADAFRVGEAAPTPPPMGKDTLRILSDFAPDGRARKIETFADGLNIPTGIQPMPRDSDAPGDTAIVFSIPNIWRMTDTDGDGRADLREPLYEGFGYTDTHGMSSNYLYWTDGWIYGCHGFRNHSEVKDRSGRVTVFDSGNTYRFRPDGSKIEFYTHGQTNPYGLTVDPLGNFFSADSHSKPVMLLIRGGFYEGIGKEHDGLGFAPTITDDDHGSSAIAGIAYYGDDKFPAEYRGNLFNGNPVTRRINRDRLEWHGSTPRAIRMPDFLTCDDPWFRPVQVKLGPDGALWIADFYTPIIGHYEVPLTDRRRDQKHGRIWRVVWRGETAESTPGTNPFPGPSAAPDVTPFDSAALLTRLNGALKEDTRLIYSLRLALRDRLSLPNGFAIATSLAACDPKVAEQIADVALAVASEDSARFLLAHLESTALGTARAGDYLKHAARNIGEEEFRHVAALTASVAQAPLPRRFALADALGTAARERKIALPEDTQVWMERTLIEALNAGKDPLLDDAIAAVREMTSENKRDALAKIVVSTKANGLRRARALDALRNLPGAFGIASFALHDPSSLYLRKKAAELLGELEGTGEAAREVLLTALPAAPTELAIVIAARLVQTHAGCSQLLDLIEHGKLPAPLLRSVFVAHHLAARDRTLRDRAAALTADLPPEDARLDKVIAERAQSFRDARPDATHGAGVFQQHCAACHRFRNTGGNVGPNLDGVATRGVHRLIEDILDPYRNVDPAFHQTSVETDAGETFTGANIREGADALTLTDATGRDVTFQKANVKARTTSKISLMPALFETLIPAADFHDLLAHLLGPVARD